MSIRAGRRAFLVGAGTLLALPFLESALPRAARANPPTSPRRLMTFHFPIGVHRAAWKPTGTESSWTLGESQAPLLPFKDDVTVVTNVDATGDKTGNSAHTGKIATFLTAADAPPTVRAMGTSADQVVAEALRGKTPLRSLELGTAILNENPNKEPAYDPVLKDHLSWSNGTPLPKEINPSALFARLFGTTSSADASDRSRRRSVLDAVRADASALEGRLGRNDKAKLDEYLTGVREIETRINRTATTCAMGQRPGPPADVRDVVRQMLDLSVLAFRCDLTRVVTFGYEHTVTERTHPWLGVNEGYHIGITHNSPGPSYAAVNRWIVSQLAYLLGQLKATGNGAGGTLLDDTIVYFASEMGDGTLHSKRDLPIIVCGGGGGRIRKGKLLDRPGQGNGNVLIALMQAMDVVVPSFGNGFTTPLPGLLNT